ncbi:putative period circadian protein [Ixodes scapularis]
MTCPWDSTLDPTRERGSSLTEIARSSIQETSDKTLPNLKDGGGAPCGDVDGSGRAFKQYATKYSVGAVPGLTGSKDKKAEDLNNHEGSDKDTQQDDSVSLSFESSFFGKSENSESQFSSEKSSEDTDTEMKIRRRKHPMRGTLREPHWTEGVNLSADLVYRYQLRAADLADVLKSDMDKLQRLQQPRLVNEQLSVLQHELEDREDLDEATAGGDDLRPKDQDIASSQGLTAAQNCACMYAMEEDLTEEMEELERRMLSSIDPDY